MTEPLDVGPGAVIVPAVDVGGGAAVEPPVVVGPPVELADLVVADDVEIQPIYLGPVASLPVVQINNVAVWTGVGPPPPVIPGAAPGDMYLNSTNGDLYILS